MNKVILTGRLTRDPEVRHLQNDKQTVIAKFSVAVPRKRKGDDGQPDCDFINCVAFGKTAESIGKHAVKGTKLLIEGRWQSGKHTDKDGQRAYTNDCVAESCEFAGSRPGQKEDGQERPQPEEGSRSIPDEMDGGLPFR